MKTLCFFNVKGGVSKTTSSLAFALILRNDYKKKVLLIDLDKQSNSTKALDCYDNEGLNVADVLTADKPMAEKVIKHSKYGIDVLPASFDLMRADKMILIDSMHEQTTRLKKQLQPIENDYDYCIIDCPTDLNMAVLNAFVVTDDVLIPLAADKYAFDGLELVVEAINDMQKYNERLQLKGCFLARYVRSKLNNSSIDYLNNALGIKFMKTYIRNTVKVGESTFDEKPLVLYSPRCNASLDYKKLVEEYLATE